MTAREAQEVRTQILDVLKARPISATQDVIEQVSSSLRVSDSDVQQVVRDLVSNAEVEVTSTWDLALPSQGQYAFK